MENLDQLVQMITDRLLENFQNKPVEKTVLLVGKESTAEQLKEAGYNVVTDVTSILVDAIVIDHLSVDSFLRVASLCPTTDVETTVLNNLLEGKKVYALSSLFDVERYKRLATQTLYRELLQQKNKLEKYGLKFFNSENLLNILGTVESKSKVIDKVFDATTHKEIVPKRASSNNAPKTKLITESKLKEMGLSEGDVFVVEKGMIVTALAKDYLKRHKITMQ